MAKRWHSLRLLFYGSIALMTLVSIFTFVSAWSRLNRPFAGFLVYCSPFVGSLGLKEWSGTEAGLKYLDRIVSMDGRPVQTGQDIVDAVNRKKVGTPVRYTVESGEKFREIVVPVGLFGLWDFVQVFLTPFLCGLALCALGAIVVFLKSDILTSWVFMVFAFSLGLYLITPFEIMTGYHLVRIHYLATVVYPFLVLHLSLIFPDKKRLLLRFPALEYLPYLPAVILIAAWQIHLTVFPELLGSNSMISTLLSHRFLGTVTRLFLFISVLIFVLLVLHSVFKASNAQARQRARMILFGVVVGFLPPGIIMLAMHLLQLRPLYQILPFFVIIFLAAVSYSIVRHNLFDADTIIKRTVGYVVVTVVVVGSYALTSLGLNVIAKETQIAQSQAFPILFTLAFILVFNPLRNRIQSLVDRLFFRKEYDSKAIIDRIGDAITSLMDLPQILRQLITTFTQDMFFDNSAVLLLNPATATYHVYLSEGENHSQIENVSFHRSEALSKVIETEKKEITRYDVLEDPKYKDICLECAQNFSTLYASLIIPMVLRGEVIGFLSLGDKKSGNFYNREDIDLLRTLAGQGAVAIENARMAEQMKNEELVRANLARYLSPQIVDQIIKQDVKVNLGGDRKEVTVLFSDIRNFTSISESMRPEQLVEFLNEYFTEMARIIFANQGSLDKYIGDAIVAVFGSLIPLENSAEAAVKASVEMMQEMVGLNEKWKDRYGFNMEMGIGINTGEVFLGNIGSPERMEFTVIGDTVNTASRFSGLAKGRQILATRSARDHLGSDFEIRQHPSTKVKGKAEEVEVFEIIY